MFRALDLTSEEGVIPLNLLEVRTIDNDVVWLKYLVRKGE